MPHQFIYDAPRKVYSCACGRTIARRTFDNATVAHREAMIAGECAASTVSNDSFMATGSWGDIAGPRCGHCKTIILRDGKCVDCDRRRLRAAMQAMANATGCVEDALVQRMLTTGMYEQAQRSEKLRPLKNWKAEYVAIASREWSAEVRRKVAALPKPGPRVACQGEEE